MWDLPGPGLEPVSPALAGRFSTTVPPGKPNKYFLKLLRKVLEGVSMWTFRLDRQGPCLPQELGAATSRPVFCPLGVRFLLGVPTREAEMLKSVLLLQDLAETPLPSA